MHLLSAFDVMGTILFFCLRSDMRLYLYSSGFVFFTSMEAQYNGKCWTHTHSVKIECIICFIAMEKDNVSFDPIDKYRFFCWMTGSLWLWMLLFPGSPMGFLMVSMGGCEHTTHSCTFHMLQTSLRGFYCLIHFFLSTFPGSVQRQSFYFIVFFFYFVDRKKRIKYMKAHFATIYLRIILLLLEER